MIHCSRASTARAAMWSRLTTARGAFRSPLCHFQRRPFSSQRRFFFGDRTYGVLALLVTVPAAAYLWKRHSNTEEAKLSSSASINTTTKLPIKPATIQTKYLIVGGGVAGFSAIESIIANDPDSQILLVSEERELPYLRPALSKELWSSDSDSDSEELTFTDWQGHSKPLLLQPASFYHQRGVQVKLSSRVQSIDPETKTAVLEDGSVIQYSQALIATGARPKTLSAVPLEAGKITTFRSLDDFLALRRSLTQRPGQRVLIVGGGFLGSELAASLAQLSTHVTQVFPESGPMALVFPKYLSEWTRDKLASLGIEIIPRATIESITTTPASEMTVHLSNGQSLRTDHVIVAIGVEPNLPQVPDSLSRPRTDHFLQLTPSLFGAGDVIEYPDRALGINRRTEHYDHAVHSGKLAGENMVRAARGEPLQEYKHESMFWSDLGKEVGYEAVGLVDSSLTTVSVWSRAGLEDQPGTAELDPSDVRIQTVGQTAIRTTEEHKEEAEGDRITSTPSNESDSKIPKYGKGVVLYLKDQKLVGVLLFNLFNRVGVARSLIAEGLGPDDINKAIQLINIHG